MHHWEGRRWGFSRGLMECGCTSKVKGDLSDNWHLNRNPILPSPWNSLLLCPSPRLSSLSSKFIPSLILTEDCHMPGRCLQHPMPSLIRVASWPFSAVFLQFPHPFLAPPDHPMSSYSMTLWQHTPLALLVFCSECSTSQIDIPLPTSHSVSHNRLRFQDGWGKGATRMANSMNSNELHDRANPSHG